MSHPFTSVLHPPGHSASDSPAPAEVLADLHLDEIVLRATAGWEEYDLIPVFQEPLADVTAIVYRQEVMRDVEQPVVATTLETFSDAMQRMRAALRNAEGEEHRYSAARWFVDGVRIYCRAGESLAAGLVACDLQSGALRHFRDHLSSYLDGPGYRRLAEESGAVAASIASVRYSLLLRDARVTVLPYGGEPDYSSIIECIFAPFRREAASDFRAGLPGPGRFNHVDARILERVARLYPREFAALEAFSREHAGFGDATLIRFDREIQFYRAWHKLMQRVCGRGLRFCYPRVGGSREVTARDVFDLALATGPETAEIVGNDVALQGGERVFVVTGPNRGGKTTFARTFGQLHYLASLGLTVPGSEARLTLADRIFTHFERGEQVGSLRGKLQDDLLRLHSTVAAATSRSIIILNEVFASTTAEDALFLARRILDEILRLDCLAVCVTFLDELSRGDPRVVSLVAAVASDDPGSRTFRIERRPADGLAYAQAIAAKYGVTAAQLAGRLRR